MKLDPEASDEEVRAIALDLWRESRRTDVLPVKTQADLLCRCALIFITWLTGKIYKAAGGVE